MLEALWQIASFQRGGVVSDGHADDRDKMIGIAREALMKHYDVGTFGAARIKAGKC